MERQSWDQLRIHFVKYRQGEDAPVRVLFENLNAILERFCASKGTSTESEDLTQQILLKIHLSRDSYNKSQSFKTWVYTVAQNTLIDFWRKQKEFGFKSEQEEFEASEALPDLSPNAEMLLEIRGMLQNSYGKLNIFDQKLIYLYGFEELSTAELAQVTGISESAVKVRIHRILKDIRNSSK